jgi:hypothetical protein
MSLYLGAVPIIPDDKNWTWVIERPCPECGYDAGTIDVTRMAELVRANVATWAPLLAHPHARQRPSDDRWSALEYACHVRDVFDLFDERLRRMLTEDGPHFAKWDQDATAIEQRYDLQDPDVVATELAAAGERCARRWEHVGPGDWGRSGVRSDGAVFTVESFARYLLHDPVHHIDDVTRGNAALAMGGRS